MCGIAGIFNVDGSPLEFELLKRMTDIQAHRGPDDYGFALFNTINSRATPFKDEPPEAERQQLYNLGFGYRRLAIIDLSPTGHQPMGNEENTIWIVHNGEVYNYIEIREELKAKGYRFKSNTDTEVILYSYQEWGTECLQRFNGMWAFAIWDGRSQRLFCARDRLGIKPFYYYYNGKLFIFASEIKALLCHPIVPRKVNEEKVYDFLAVKKGEYQDDTFFEGIKQLSPAHYFLLDRNGRLEIRRWWDLKKNSAQDDFSGNKGQEYAEHLLALFEDSIKLRVRADVPIGTSLSGGLDSSSIVCLANRILFNNQIIDRQLVGERQKTFSSCFEDSRLDERNFIERVVDKTGVERNYVFPEGNRFWEELPQLIWHQDQPFGGASVYAQWNVMRQVAQSGVKVLLDGQGADELFGGYRRFYTSYLSQIARSGRVVKLFREAKKVSAFEQRSTASFLASALYLLLPFRLRLMAHQSIFGSASSKVKALNPSFARRFSQRGLAYRKKEEEGVKSIHEASYQATFIITLPQILRWADRNSMASSIETRFPFLDYRIVEYAFSLPATQKIRDGWTKWVLRQAMVGIIPEEVRLRRDKLGFPAPEALWLRQGKERITELLSGDILSAEFINPRFILKNLDSLLSQDTTAAPEVWRAINLELWLRMFFGGKRRHDCL
ncbi:asparagine synthase (glutamine-hydrolyzing) [Chloroflexota bacterium]